MSARPLPPVRSLVWATDRPLAPAAWLDDARARTALDAEPFARMLWHGGLHAAGGRLQAEALPAEIAAGRASAYWFEHEPEPVTLAADAVLLDADGVVAVAKPAGMHTQPTRASTRLCLEHAARERLGDPGLRAIHRLDCPTSGVLLLARNRAATAFVYQQLAGRRLHRTYAAVVTGVPAADRWTVSGTLVQAPHPNHAFYRFEPGAAPGGATGGRFSITDFEALALEGGCALLRALPRTGRTHQLRVHLAAGGTPIAGDSLYGDAAPQARLLLHAAELRVRLPGAAAAVEVRAPFDDAWPAWAREAWHRAPVPGVASQEGLSVDGSGHPGFG